MTRSAIKTLPSRAQPSLVERMTIAATEALARRRDRQILTRPDAHILRDIGRSPDEAQSEAAKPFWQP